MKIAIEFEFKLDWIACTSWNYDTHTKIKITE